MIKNKVYSVNDYCDEFFGLTIERSERKDALREFLDKIGYEHLRDYRLDEIGSIVEFDLDVALVDVSYIEPDSFEVFNEFRWFQIPEIKAN